MTDAITREEKLMKAIATGSPSNIKPITREEMFLAKAGGQDVETPGPITRREKLLQGIIDNGGGGGSTGGGGDIDALIDGSITEVTSNTGKVRAYAFYDSTELTTANFPMATTIESRAFECSSTKGNKLNSINAPRVTQIGSYAFKYCVTLKNVVLPLVTSIASGAFSYCKALTTADFPLLESIENDVFNNCQSLVNVKFPLVKNIKTNGLLSCKALTTADFPLLESIGQYAFSRNGAFTTLILRSETVCTLSNVNAFNNTPFAIGGTGGEAYVPQALIEEYKIATNWSTLYEAGTVTFVAKEGSKYE